MEAVPQRADRLRDQIAASIGSLALQILMSIEQPRAQWQRVSRLFLREQAARVTTCKMRWRIEKVLYNLWYDATFSGIEIVTMHRYVYRL